MHILKLFDRFFTFDTIMMAMALVVLMMQLMRLTTMMRHTPEVPSTYLGCMAVLFRSVCIAKHSNVHRRVIS